jgi:hypothetical protein
LRAADKRSGMKPELRHVGVYAWALVRGDALVLQREPWPPKSWFQNRTELRKETQALQGERSKTGWMPVENGRRRRAPRICRAATGGFESSS